MESDEERDSVHGKYPEFGAIFMSNSATKRECLRRRMFALPSSQGQFVEQVKTGMIMFLFEYERRELHGVFQACSDGAMNIFRRAYISSGKGKQFPAQVKVKLIWRCHPLSESVFSDAIKENYFSKGKFHFGLSKSQVRRLLTLFSSRKVKNQRPPRELAISKEASPVYMAGKVREVDDERSVLRDKVDTERDADNNNGPMMTQYQGNSFWNVGREDGGRLGSEIVDNKVAEIIQSGYFGHFPDKDGISESKFAICERTRNELHVDIDCATLTEYATFGEAGRGDGDLVMRGRAGSVNCLDAEIAVTSTEYPGYLFAEAGRIYDDARLLMSDKLQIENSEGNVFRPAISTENPAFFQSSFHRPVCPGLPVEETDSLVYHTRSTSTVSHQMELPITSQSYTAPIVTSTLPYDPDAATNLPHSPSIGVSHSSNSVQDCYDLNGIPSLVNQLSPLNTQPKGINRSLDGTYKFDVRFPFVSSDHYEHSCHGNILPFPGAAYSEERALRSSGKHSYGGPSLKSSLAPGTFAAIGSDGREIKIPSSNSLSPSSYPSFVIDHGHPVVLQNKLEHEVAEKLKYEKFTTNVISSENLQPQLRSCVHPGDRGSADKSYETSEGMRSDLLTNRSVFSRLALNPDTHVKRNSSYFCYEGNDMDTSVDEVMAMLSESRYPWAKSKKSKRPTGRYDDVENFRNNKQITVHSELGINYLETIPKKSNMTSATPTEDKDDQRSEKIPFVDFKRRSELRKVNGDMKARAKDESAVSDRLSGGQCKRRKLIRPNFSGEEPRNDKSSNGDTSLILQKSQESFVSARANGKRRTSLILQVSQESSASANDNGKKRKLVRPNFRENEPCDVQSINGNTPINLQVPSQQCYVSEDASGNCEASVGNQGKLLVQGTGLLHVVYQSSHENESINGNTFINLQVSSQQCYVSEDDSGCRVASVGSQGKLLVQGTRLSDMVYQSSNENENIETAGCPKYEREMNVEGGKDSLYEVGSQIASFAIPYEDNDPNAQKDLDYNDPTVNVSSQDCHENSHSTVQGSAWQIPKPNSGTTNVFSEIECGRGNEMELLPRVEFCPTSGDRSIGNLIDSSRKENSELKRVPKEVANCVDTGIGDNHHGACNKQSELSLDTVGCHDKKEPLQKHESSKLSEASFGSVGCYDKQEPLQEHESGKLSEASFGTVGCYDKQEPSQKHESSELSETSFGHVGCYDKQEPSQEHEFSKLSEASFGTVGCYDKQEPSQKHESSKLSEASFVHVGCYDKQEPVQEHESSKLSEASFGTVDCYDKKKPSQKHESIKLSKASFGRFGCYDKQEPSQEHESSKLSEASFGTAGCLKKPGPSQVVRDINIRFGENLFILSNGFKNSEIDSSKHVGERKDVLPISSSNAFNSSDIGTSDNVEDRKGLLANSGGIKKGELKTAYNCSKSGTSEHVADRKDVIPISSNIFGKSSKISTSKNVDDRKDPLPSSGDDCASFDSERENKRLWSILTSKLKHMKNAQQK